MLCRAIRTATHWGGSRRGHPLHALACTRRLRTVAKPFTQFQEMPWHARAPLQLNNFNWNRGARGRRDFRNTGPRAAARPEPLAVPRHIGAPEAGRARCGSPPSLAPLGARARPICHEYAGADSLGRARCSPATGSAHIAFRSAAPVGAFSHALLHAWSTKGRPHRKKRPARPDCAGGAHVRTALAALLILRGWLGGGERARPLLHGGTWAAQEEEACGRIILGSTVRIPSAGGRIHSGACGHRGTRR